MYKLHYRNLRGKQMLPENRAKAALRAKVDKKTRALTRRGIEARWQGRVCKVLLFTCYSRNYLLGRSQWNNWSISI